MKDFKPVEIREKYIKKIAKGIEIEIWETVFKGLFETIADNNVYNSISPLITALKKGTVFYERGAFRSQGKFNNEISLEMEELGAHFKYGAYYIDKAVLPADVLQTLAAITARETTIIAGINSYLMHLTANAQTALKSFIEGTVKEMFITFQNDLRTALDSKKIPVVDISTEIHDLHIKGKKLDDITKYWETSDKHAGKLHDKWKSKVNEVNELTEKLKTAPNKDKEGMKQALERAKTQKENARQELYDFRLYQRNNTPKVNIIKDTIKPDISKIDKRAAKIAQDYTYNMDYWVKNWKAKNITKMRKDILKMVQEGKRLDDIKKYIQNKWKIASKKAAFLARCESGIASSVIQATEFQERGYKYFAWHKSKAKEKRPLHLEYAKEINNQYGIDGMNVFSFENPPIIEQKKIKKADGSYEYIPDPDGSRGLPRQTYNCLCGMTPIIDPNFYARVRKINNAKRNIFTKIKNAIQNSTQRHNNPWRYRRFGEGAAF